MTTPIDVDIDEVLGTGPLANTTFADAIELPVRADIEASRPTILGSIGYLIAYKFQPAVDTAYDELLPAEECLGQEDGSWDKQRLLRTPIPDERWLADLHFAIRRKWRERVPILSVTHPTKREERFPLWISTYWSQISRIREHQKIWRKGIQWILQIDIDRPEKKTILERLDAVSWSESLWMLRNPDSQSSIAIIGHLLSPTSWVTELQLDSMAVYLNERAPQDYYLAPVDLSVHLQVVSRFTEDQVESDQTLTYYTHEVVQRNSSHILLPAVVNGNHWILFYVDRQEQRYTHGDSLSQETYPTLPDLCTGLEKWLNHSFPGKFSYGGRQLPIGQQDDGSSCGLCVMNAAEHKMLGAPLVTPDRSQHIRVQYFFDILTHVLRDPTITRIIPGPPRWWHSIVPPANVQRLAADTEKREQLRPPVKKVSNDPPTTSGSESECSEVLAPAMALEHRVGQGYQRIGFDGERALVSKAFIDCFLKGKSPKNKILSTAARKAIRAALETNVYDGRKEKQKPSYMAPSADPADYSMWCSLCTDFGANIVLCATCRIGVCVHSTLTGLGCVEWDASIEKDDFIFRYPYCGWGKGGGCSLRLRDQWGLPERRDVLFRCDSPVLIVSATWHEKKARFSSALQRQLAVSYAGHEDWIMLADISLDGSETSSRRNIKPFLSNNPTAKILVLVDTHCLEETGAFVWKGTDEPTYEACYLQELLQALPKEVIPYLSCSKSTPKHSHKSLVLNLSCGASITQKEARHAIMLGHCAEAVISFSNVTTVVGEVGSVVMEIARLWAQTLSDYETIFARVLRQDWARRHRPVLSRGDNHYMYTGYHITEPDGELVHCHRGCGIEGRTWKERPDGSLDITCHGCNSTCKVPLVRQNWKTDLGVQGIVKVKFPRPQVKTTWRFNEDTKTSIAPGALRPADHSSGVKTQPSTHRPSPSVPTIALAAPPVPSPALGPQMQRSSRLVIRLPGVATQPPTCLPSPSAPTIRLAPPVPVLGRSHSNPQPARRSLRDIPAFQATTDGRDAKRQRKR